MPHDGHRSAHVRHVTGIGTTTVTACGIAGAVHRVFGDALQEVRRGACKA
jgi:hypothetical protein